MKKIIIGVALVLFLTSPAFANGANGWCSTMNNPPGSSCRNIHWTDLGYFHPTTGAWVWEYEYYGELFAQFHDSTVAQFTPYRAPTPAAIPFSGRMLYANIRDAGNGGITKETRVDFQLPSSSSWTIYWPEFAEVTWTDGNGPLQVTFGANFTNPPDYTIPFMLSEPQGPPISLDQISKIHWVEKDIDANHKTQINNKRWPLVYSVNTDPQNLGRFNFWTVQPPNQQLPVTGTGVSAFFDNEIPEPGVTNTMEVHLDNGLVIILKFMEMDTSEFPPIIRTKQVLKSKAIEKDGSLIVQWPGAEVLEPYVEMFVNISNGADLRSDPSPVDNEFIWVDSPSQLGTVVIPSNIWSSFKQLLVSEGHSEASCNIHYRYIWAPPPPNAEGKAQSSIRSISQSFEIPLQQ